MFRKFAKLSSTWHSKLVSFHSVGVARLGIMRYVMLCLSATPSEFDKSSKISHHVVHMGKCPPPPPPGCGNKTKPIKLALPAKELRVRQ